MKKFEQILKDIRKMYAKKEEAEAVKAQVSANAARLAELEVLEKELDGYTEYKKKVKYRLIPFIW